ncbi:unnamed protein product [Schistosoma margrebowiei]|uniref:Leishmanolysin-like peptidase n=1 Tax=Schistosoma margrebowiei TaxID=48269 RepID=A0A183MEM0_9TREM|nr:unnamed protein product [Schistosoma margrebowiei]
MKDCVDAQLRDQQAGFHKERSCSDQIATLRIIVEQSIEWNSSLYINFIEYENAFDSVDRRTLWKLLRHHGVPQKIVNIIQNPYDGLNCKIVHGGQLTKSIEVKTGVMQGEDDQCNSSSGSNRSQYTQKEEQGSPIDGEDLKDEKTSTYLGSIIDEQGGSDADVKARIDKARAAYLQLKNIWNSKQLSTNTKSEIMAGRIQIDYSVSRVTLGFFEDSGWYIVDYSKAMKWEYGRQLGCDFSMKSCFDYAEIRRQHRRKFIPFCDTINEARCRDAFSYGTCSILRYHDPVPIEDRFFLKAPFDTQYGPEYFGGEDPFKDYCPTMAVS